MLMKPGNAIQFVGKRAEIVCRLSHDIILFKTFFWPEIVNILQICYKLYYHIIMGTSYYLNVDFVYVKFVGFWIKDLQENC
jgi:hypothetical protein